MLNNDYLIMWSIKRAISGGATTNIQAPTAGNRPPCISVMPQGIYISEQISSPATITFAGLLDVPDDNGETLTQSPVFGLGIDFLSNNSKQLNIWDLEKKIINEGFRGDFSFFLFKMFPNMLNETFREKKRFMKNTEKIIR